jgi:hypothetical protein
MNNNEARSIPLPQTNALPLSTASILRSEWTFVIATIAAILFLTSLPFLYAYLTTPPDKQFMGIMVNVPDHAQYFSWYRELAEANLSANKLTPEPNAPIFFNLMWWVLGRMGALLGVGYPVMYQFMRIAGAIFFLLLAYRVCAWFLKDTLQRRVAFLIIALGAGFGWVLIVLKYTLTNGELINPLDVFVAEPNTFYSILAFPHFVAAALYILSFDLILRGQAKGQLRYAVYAGLWALFMGWQHAYDLFIVYAVLGAYALLLFARDRKLPWYVIKATVIVGLISFWPGLYSFLITSLDPVWKAVLAQFDNAGVFTPPLYRLPVLLGIPFVLAVFTVIADFVRMLRAKRTAVAPAPAEAARPSDNDLFLKGWFLVSFVLIYLPVDFQIHMLNGWQVPIAILATRAVFDYIAPFIRRHSARANASRRPRRLDVALGALIVLLVIPTNIYLWAWRFVDLRRHDYPYYLHKEELAAMRWIEANAKGDDVVLSSLTIGQYVPMLTGAHAYLGHWAQTLDFFGKTQAVERFFAADTAELERQAILSAHDVDYVFVGPAERTLGSFDPSQSGLYERVYASPLVSVYRTTDNP